MFSKFLFAIKQVSVFFIIILFTNVCNNKNEQVFDKIEIRLSLDKSKEKINITYILPAVEEDSLLFHLRIKASGSFYPFEIKEIENFQAFDKNNSLLPVQFDSLFYIIQNARNLAKINYSVRKSEINPDNLLIDGTIIDDELIVINNGVTIGYINIFEKFPINVIYSSVDGNKCISKNYQTLNKSTVLFTFKDYTDLVNNPIILSTIADSVSFMIDDNNISIYTHSPNHKICSETMLNFVKPSIESMWNELKFLPKDDYKVVFIFNRMIKNRSSYEGIAYKDLSVYYLYSEPDLTKIKDSLQFAFYMKALVAHEITHIFTPVAFSDKILQSCQFSDFKMSQHLWLYEGFTSYFPLKTLYKYDVITKNEFFDEMSRRLRYFEKNSKKNSLTQQSENVIHNKIDFLDDFYTKGVIISFLLDMEIIDKTNGEQDLSSVLQKIYSKTPIFAPDSLFHYIVSYSDKSISDFFTQYISGNSFPDFNTTLKKAGLLLDSENVAERTFYGFSVKNIEFDDIQKILTLNFWTKPKEINQNTIYITSINDLPLSSYSTNMLVGYFQEPHEVKITYIENNLPKSVKIKMTGRSYDIKEFLKGSDLTKKQQMVFDRIFVCK